MDNSIASRLRRKKRLGDLLLGAGVITQEQLEEALKKQKEAGNGQKLGMTLVDMGIMNDEIIGTLPPDGIRASASGGYYD